MTSKQLETIEKFTDEYFDDSCQISIREAEEANPALEEAVDALCSMIQYLTEGTSR